jgi:hypothetical protein
MPTITIKSLRGGMNDLDPPTELADDQCVRAVNVEFHASTMGERRRGSDAIAQTGGWPFAGFERCVWLHRHLPTTDQADAQLWALCIDDTGPTAKLAYKDTTWHTVTMPDALTIDGVSEYQIDGVSLHGKLFIAYNSAVDRLHVFDTRTSTSALRRVGMVEPSAAPTAADSGSGTFATTRYYRTRETVQVSGTTILRSEPSAVLTKTPSGSGSGLTVTKPATTNSDPAATHWELEASLDNSNFYVIATTAIGTSTATDTTAAGTGYGAFELSEDVGDYLPPHSARYLIADEDRLDIFGSFEDEDADSSMSWTPVFNATGVGNDERITLDPVSVINLDGFEGGRISDVWSAVAGEIWVFKDYHTYKVNRTGIRINAYEAHTISKTRGAIEGSVCEGVDESGNPALYFMDPSFGACRARYGVIQSCGRDVWNTFQTVNLDAEDVVCRSLYYPTTLQVLVNLATDDADAPDLGLTLQTNEQRETPGGDVRRGWATRTGPSTGALTMCLFSDNIDAGAARSRVLVPFIGVEGNGLIWRLDTGDDDNGTEYTARLTTKPYAPTHIQTAFEIKSATVVGKAVEDATAVISVIRNFDETDTKVTDVADFTPSGSEAHVSRYKDDLCIADCVVAQIDVADPDTPGARWELARLSLTVSAGQES